MLSLFIYVVSRILSKHHISRTNKGAQRAVSFCMGCLLVLGRTNLRGSDLNSDFDPLGPLFGCQHGALEYSA